MSPKLTERPKRQRLLSLTILLGLVTLLSLSACGENSPTASSTTQAVQTSQAATTTAPATTAAITTAVATMTTTVASATTQVATTAPTTSAATTVATTAASTTTSTSTTADTSPKVVEAANAFLATLDATQKTAVLFDFTNQAQKSRWSNLPQGAFSRAGLMWGNLTETQKQAWLTVMSTTLSKQGYERLLNAWNGDQTLATGGGGGGLTFGIQYYWLALIGTPSLTTPWQWQFGGHHFTLNATVVGSNIALTPSYIGAQPTTYTDSSGKQIRPLGDIEQASFAFLNSLDATQKAKAVLGSSTIDVVLGPGQDGKTLTAEGLPGSAMTADQQTQLLALMGLYNSMLNEEDAAIRTANLKANLAQTYFAWYGSTTAPNSYFRVTGPTIVIEYAPQGGGGPGGGGPGGAPSGGGVGTAATPAAASTVSGANTTTSASTVTHIHGIYRDPTNDYGVGFIKK